MYICYFLTYTAILLRKDFASVLPLFFKASAGAFYIGTQCLFIQWLVFMWKIQHIYRLSLENYTNDCKDPCWQCCVFFLRTLCFFVSMWQIRESGKSEILDQKFFSEIKVPRSLYFVTDSNYCIFFNTSECSEFLGRLVFNQDIRRIASVNVVGLWTTEAPGRVC